MSINTKNSIEGINTIQILNSKFVTNYQYKDDLIQFNSIESQTNKKGINYEGAILLKPFKTLILFNL